MAETDATARHADVDKALETWRQGDCVVGTQWFAHRIDADDDSLVETEVAGLVVVTQTCDIVRSSASRPYVDVSPLVEIEEEGLHEIERGRRPQYGFIPLLAASRLVADLDRTMSVEKPVVARWARVPGWDTDEQAREFASSLARKRARFAFPDDFVALTRKLETRLKKTHAKDSAEGRALRALREIRVQAAPNWDAPEVEITMWFVPRDDANIDAETWSSHLEAWLKLVVAAGRFTVQGQIAALEDLTAADYVSSDAFDLDHLSSRR